ncbi:hypothetical protein BBW65_07400 [Helicobacter enhydrae]|uniref:RNA-binding S4 domain-containing protein n=1 Tax=Helicobacter enhydrae TaxID=222136 RepID=A0A1B1U7G7_9HELI|nr:TlyA family RNA methyltransferase [Helicobacter enhydrae]ANV98632.1 hypothetical protein BBW65_07400 [Helicobacter enhydrae]
MRIDCYLLHNGHASSRQKAQELIAMGCVWVNSKPCDKNSLLVAQGDCVEVVRHKQWVSRAGYKLDGFLKTHAIELEGQRVLDIGSSTGGFSEVLLEYGAREITCVDVGSSQLHPTLRGDPRIIVCENQDIRDFVAESFDFVVCDVSFISLRLLLDKIFSLTSKECLLLFKPQFEVGKNIKRDKKGVIKDLSAVSKALEEFLQLVRYKGFGVLACEKSLIEGKNGNEEYFIYLSKS